MKKLLILLILAIPYVSFADMMESENLRCGNSLVLKGDSQYEVIQKCGEPTRKETLHYNSRYRITEVEQWTYDFGPQEFIYLVRFKTNGTVSYMFNTGNYGIKEPTIYK